MFLVLAGSFKVGNQCYVVFYFKLNTDSFIKSINYNICMLIS